MHIEPGIVHGAKMALAYATAAGAAGYTAKLAWEDLRASGAMTLAARSAVATAGVFVFFEVLPHFPAGVSEVHFILATTLFLILGAAPAAIGLASGLLIQGLFFAPGDLPMYLVNLTTLLVPLFALQALSRRIVAPHTPYVSLGYRQVLAMSAAYQGGIVAWVVFWALWGQGVGVESFAALGSFGAAYLLVIVVEPIADLAVLAAAKGLRERHGGLFQARLYNPA